MKNSFEEVFIKRKSVTNFIEGIEISDKELEEIFELTSLSPSCFNLQHTNYIVIKDKSKKDEFREKVCPQYKVKTASAVIMVLGDKDAYKKMEQTHGYLKDTDIDGYNKTVKSIKDFYESRGECFPTMEAIRNASLSAMSLMLIAKDKGYDTCPMLGFNYDEAIRFFELPDNLIPILLITMGKEDLNKAKVREPRKRIEDFVKII